MVSLGSRALSSSALSSSWLQLEQNCGTSDGSIAETTAEHRVQRETQAGQTARSASVVSRQPGQQCARHSSHASVHWPHRVAEQAAHSEQDSHRSTSHASQVDLSSSSTRTSTFSTCKSIPLVERNVRRARVVGHQHGPDQQECVGEATGGQCPVERLFGVAGTQGAVPDVRMGDFVPPDSGFGPGQ